MFFIIFILVTLSHQVTPERKNSAAQQAAYALGGGATSAQQQRNQNNAAAHYQNIPQSVDKSNYNSASESEVHINNNRNNVDYNINNDTAIIDLPPTALFDKYILFNHEQTQQQQHSQQELSIHTLLQHSSDTQVGIDDIVLK